MILRRSGSTVTCPSACGTTSVTPVTVTSTEVPSLEPSRDTTAKTGSQTSPTPMAGTADRVLGTITTEGTREITRRHPGASQPTCSSDGTTSHRLSATERSILSTEHRLHEREIG